MLQGSTALGCALHVPCRSPVHICTAALCRSLIPPAVRTLSNNITFVPVSASSGDSVTTTATSPEEAGNRHRQDTATSILWFKHDLRIDDHPGLHEALSLGEHVIPVFCFDSSRYLQLVHSPVSANALARAVTSLRDSLRALGSDLIIITGAWEEEIPAIAAAVGATTVVTEEEMETMYRQGLEGVAAALTSSSKDGDISLRTWTAPLYNSYGDNYKGVCFVYICMLRE